ncbi:MAG TPA: DUF2239 family protein [Candidatus Hydrogenedentes bacterium]|nr:DUF2239 family protein [Candidatus Hydrogenedentota bacterium]HPG69999.1 DUF2239 family protein [Candidatus Hydrogenedentota bacterium]
MDSDRTYTAFAGDSLIFSGDLTTMLLRTKERIDGGERAPILIFDDQTGGQTDFDFRGTPDEVLSRIASHPLFAGADAQTAAKRGPGRPKLGVVSREVSLLPRHWDWLERQRGGISVTLRRLVDEERKRNGGRESVRQAWEAAAKFMWTMAGNLPNFEETSRVLYARDQPRMDAFVEDWPVDIRDHLRRLVARAVGIQNEAHRATGGE